MKSASILSIAATGLSLGGSTLAVAQVQPGGGPANADALQSLDAEVRLLLKQQDEIKKQQDALNSQQDQLKALSTANTARLNDLLTRIEAATGKPIPRPSTVPGTAPVSPPTAAPPAAKPPPPGIQFRGDVAMRTEDTHVGTVQTGLAPTGDRASLRSRFRLMALAPFSQRAEAAVQITTGQGFPGSPTIPSFPVGDDFRAKETRFSLAYVGYHFGPTDVPADRGVADNNDGLLLFGKMPNPFWRSDAGGFSTEMIWSRYVYPEGVALRVPLKRTGPVTVSNTVGYFPLFQQPNAIFQGVQTNIWSVVDQLKADGGWAKGAAQYLHFHNLNAGLHVPSFTTGLGGGINTPDAFVDQNAGVMPFLLRPDVIQATNNRGSLGGGQLTGVSEFMADHFDVLNLTGQILPGRVLPALRSHKYQSWITADYAHNFSVRRDRNGYAFTVGVGHDPAGNDITKQSPPLKGAWSTWLTYRDVDADATLAPYTDSDFGGGTDYRGAELGVNYRLRTDLLGQVILAQWRGFPLKTNELRRLFLDFVKFF